MIELDFHQQATLFIQADPSYQPQPTLCGITLLETIGEGSFAKVRKGKFGERDLAIKQCKADFLRSIRLVKYVDGLPEFQTALERLEYQLNITEHFNHPNISRNYFVISSPLARKFFLIQELGDLGPPLDSNQEGQFWMSRPVEQFLQREVGESREVQCLWLLKQILQGLVYLHNQLIAHRDIKWNNFVLSSTGVLKIIDFGTAVKLDRPGSLSFENIGTSAFKAPEMVLQEESGYSAMKADMWSLGMCIWVFMRREMPWRGECQTQLGIQGRQRGLGQLQSGQKKLNRIVQGLGCAAQERITAQDCLQIISE